MDTSQWNRSTYSVKSSSKEGRKRKGAWSPPVKKKKSKTSPSPHLRGDTPPPSGANESLVPGSPSLGRDTGAQVQCELCSEGVSQSSKLTHILVYHHGKIVLTCPSCVYTNGGDVRQLKAHIKKKHPGQDVNNYRDERMNYFDDVQALAQRCFPGSPPIPESQFSDKTGESPGSPEKKAGGRGRRDSRKRLPSTPRRGRSGGMEEEEEEETGPGPSDVYDYEFTESDEEIIVSKEKKDGTEGEESPRKGGRGKSPLKGRSKSLGRSAGLAFSPLRLRELYRVERSTNVEDSE